LSQSRSTLFPYTTLFRSESDWLKKLPKLPGVLWWGSGFKCGFVNFVVFRPATAFPKHAATVFASTPIDSISLERLTVESLREVLDRKSTRLNSSHRTISY